MGGGGSSPPLSPAAQTPQQRWPGYPAVGPDPISWSDGHHILHGDYDNPRSGGHLAGTGRPGKTEFPPEWDEDACISAVTAVARQPERAMQRPDDTWEVRGTHRGVLIRVFLRPDGSVEAGHPISGPGVRRNPRKGQ